MIHLQRAMIEGLTDPQPHVHAVWRALQSAVELEHATIPPYLYALYSLDRQKNAAIAGIIESIVIEEMLHMTLSSNILNALGGTPRIGHQGFIPTYPGPLPGSVDSDLIVNLAPFSTTQLQTFLTIEEPEDPLHFKAALASSNQITIGEFYKAIYKAITNLGNGAFKKPPRNQVGPDIMFGSVVVHDVPTAQQAITIIIDQGEGTSTSPKEVFGSGYAHYYRFQEIQKGHLLVEVPGETDPNKKYTFTGAPVPFDPSGVFPLPSDPGLPPGYPPNSLQKFANDNFNYTYTSLLNALKDLFNGQNTASQFNRALGLMMSLKGQAEAMMSGIPDPKVFTGPSFEYQPTNPAI